MGITTGTPYTVECLLDKGVGPTLVKTSFLSLTCHENLKHGKSLLERLTPDKMSLYMILYPYTSE